jgi:hypothetical protein
MSPNNFSLPQLQNWMQTMLLQPDVNDDIGIQQQVNNLINSSQRLSAVRHLDIYRQSYIARLRACMQNQFAALAYALGTELFELFADQYLEANPSDSYTLNTLGERFPAFLQATRPDAAAEQKESWPDFMVELAGFEYALSGIFDEHAIECNDMPTDDAPDDELRLTPVFHLFHHQFPICNYYLQYCQNKTPQLPLAQESFCVVTRLNYKLGLFPIRGAQYYFLERMKSGKPVNEAASDLIDRFNFSRKEFDAIWPEWRRSFIASGFFCV